MPDLSIESLAAALTEIEERAGSLPRKTLAMSMYRSGFYDALNQIRSRYEIRLPAGGEEAAPEAEPELLECSFCGWEDSPDWVVPREKSSHHGPGSEEHALCGFCYNSHAASRWLAGSHWDYEYMERDHLFAANMLRAITLGHEVTR